MTAITALSAAALASVGDPGRTRLVGVSIVVLLAVGVGLAIAAVWLYRTTRQDHPVLAPLELMGERSWRRADPVFQRRSLDDVRPPAAQPLARMSPVPVTDEEFDRGPRLGGVDDLAEEVDAVEVAHQVEEVAAVEEVAPVDPVQDAGVVADDVAEVDDGELDDTVGVDVDHR